MPNSQDPALQEYNRLYRRYDRVWHDLALEAGMSDSALLILYFLLEKGGCCPLRELCCCTCVSKQTIHSALEKLREQGTILRETGKGREVILRLSPAGRELAEARLLPFVELENDTFRRLGPEESRELLRLTARYLDLFEENAREHIKRSKHTHPH